MLFRFYLPPTLKNIKHHSKVTVPSHDTNFHQFFLMTRFRQKSYCANIKLERRESSQSVVSKAEFKLSICIRQSCDFIS